MTSFYAKALIVDDEEDICELIAISFSTIGIACQAAYSVSDAIVALQKEAFDVCITDLRLPDDDGFSLISYVQEYYPHMPIAMITAHGNVESAVEALKRGAFDFISKPFELDALRNLAIGAIQSAREDVQLSGKMNTRALLGDSVAMDNVRMLIEKFSRSQAPVFIQGESGTGKELAAHAIHESSARQQQPFIAVNCGAIPEHLVESEFFGHKKGSFTGADRDKLGLFEAAHRGTLFLDEVADLPQSMQVKLLRAIQERAVRPVGGTEEIPIDVRIISATHKPLEKMVAMGQFRQDLFYRLNVIHLPLPPLRARLEDLPALCSHLLARINQKNGTQVLLTDQVITALQGYQFPGNVRELENILERACALSDGQMLQVEDLNLDLQLNTTQTDTLPKMDVSHDSQETRLAVASENMEMIAPSESTLLTPSLLQSLPKEIPQLEDFLDEIERVVIKRALNLTKNNKTQAAERLGISFRSFRHRMKKLMIED